MRWIAGAAFILAVLPFYVTALSKYLRDPEICGNPNCPNGGKLSFSTKVKYKYEYNVEVNTIFDGSGNKTSKMTISSHFFIYFKSPCEAILQILDADLVGDENDELAKKYRQLFNSEMTKNYLRFSFEDGRISQICPMDNEHVWVFNFKKGILSSLQNNMKRLDVDHRVYERDINGDCTTVYTFRQQNGTTLVISKKKLIPSCANRHTFYSIIPLSNYVFQHKYHKWTPMNSSVGCHQEIDHGILTRVVCNEEHTYQPFHNQPDGVKSTARNELILISEDRSLFSDPAPYIKLGLVKHRDDLLFDHRRPKRATHDDIYDCKVLLRRLCVLSTDEFQAEFPEVFNQFIHVARDLSTPALSQLFKDSNSTCLTARKHMKDALPFIRSRASTYLMTQVLLNREISEGKILDWLTIMAFFPSPDKETIDSVSTLLKQKHVDDQALLSVSAMVHSFCENRPQCESHPSVQEIISILELRFNNTMIQIDETQRILGLKGVQNAGVLTPTMAQSLVTCINDHKENVEIRLHCINAHKRMPCQVNLEPLIKVFTNQSNNQEIRIGAYMQIMRCPSYYTFKIVKHQLEVEEFNQVGSFVWSHLQNIVKSSMPSRMEFQAMLQDEHLDYKFKRDFRKYSRHYENSFFLNSIGIGGIVENIVIFSEKSFIPRQLTTNLTIYLFGETVNICELTLRLEGLDEQLEKQFKRMNLGDVLQQWTNKVNPFKHDGSYKGLNMARYIRDLSQTFNDHLNYTHPLPEQLRITLSMKTFGNDLKYYVILGDEQFNNILQSLNPLKIIKDFLSGQEVNIEKSIMLMDTSYVTPMCSGLPLKFNIVGTTAIFVNAMGYVKWDQATESEPDSHLEIEGKLRPSIGFNFEAYMYVDAFVEQTGVKFKGNVYTSTAFEGNVDAKGFKHITVSFNLPMKKSQIFNAESQLMIVKGEKTMFLEGVTGRKTESLLCSWSILDETIGLKLCLNYLLPDASLILQSPSFLFSGPLKLGLTLEKSDPTANKFLFEYKMETVSNKTLGTLSFETPGSQTKRAMKAVIDLDTQSQNLTFFYQSNLTTVQAQGYYRNTPTEKVVDFGLDINGKKHIDVHIGLEIEEERYGSTYKPSFLLAINNKKIACLSGSYKWVDKSGVSQCDINLDFQTNKFSTKIVGYVRKNDVSVSTKMNIDYVFMSGRPETVVVLVTLVDKSVRHLTQFVGLLQLESSAYPQINMSSTLKCSTAQGHKDCRINLMTLEADERKKLYIQWAFKQLGPFLGTDSKLNTSLVISKQNSEIDVALGVSLQVSHQSTTSNLIVQYATGKRIQAVLDLVLPQGNNFTFETKLMIVIPQAVEPFNILFKIKEKTHKGEYDIEFVGTWFSSHRITVKGVYLDRSTLSLTSHSVKLLARSELFNDLHLSSRFVMSADDCRADFKAEYLKVIYGISVRHSTQAVGTYETFAELKYNTSLYTVSNFIDLIRRQTVFEFHLDRYRDIRIQLKGFTNKTRLDSGIDVRWDANRDPTRKFIFLAMTNAHGNFNYDGKLHLEYPDKVITLIGFTRHEERTYKGDLKLEWSPSDEIRLTMRAMHDIRKRGVAQMDATLTTPFKNWESTQLNYSMRMQSNWLVSYCSVSWLPDQNIKMEISYDYLFSENSTDLNLRSFINSTVAEINSMHAIFKYNQGESSYKTDFSLKTTAEHVISLESAGDIEYKEDDSSKYRLSVFIKTPFSLLKQTSMSSELNLYPENKMKASVHFTGNGKKYGTYIEGDLQYLNESKINVHLATPFEKYKQVSGKYSFSASRKHFVVEIKSTAASIGTEILFIYNNITNFNTKLHFHTSLIMATNVLLVGKLSQDTVDMRIGWSKVLVGLIASSHYTKWYDVDYSLQLFTPVEGFHSCSAIAKFIFTGKNKLDFEASVNFADKKIGLRIQGMEEPDDDFAVPPTVIVLEQKSSNASQVDIPPDVGRLEATVPPFGAVYWRGLMQLDSLLYPTVYVYTQVNQDDTEYYLATFFNFPFGQLKISDEFKFDDYVNIKNTLSVETTSDYLQELNGFFQLSGDMTEATHLSSRLELSKTSHDVQMKGKMDLKYYFEPEHENVPLEGKYEVVLNVITPFELLPYFHGDVKLKAEKHSYACNMSMALNNTSLHLDGTLEFDETYLESNVGIQLNSSMFVLPMSRLIVNKDFGDFDKKLDVELELPDGTGAGFAKYGVGAVWNNMAPNFRKYFGHIITPYKEMGTLKGGIVISSNVEEDQFFMEIFLKYSESNEIKMKSSLKGNKLNLVAETSFEGFRDMNVSTVINRIGKVNSLEATLRASKHYQILCWATFAKDQPITVEIKMLRVPNKEEVFGVIANVYNLKNGYDIDALLTLYNNQVTLRGNYVAWDQIGKHIDAVITSTFPGYESLKIDGIMLSRSEDAYICRVTADIDSSKLALDNVRIDLDLNLALEDSLGLLECKINSPFFQGQSLVKWINMFLERMMLTMDAEYTFNNDTKDLYADFYTWNTDKEFQEISFGSQIKYNRDIWSFIANGTLLALSMHDIKLLSHLLLPNKKDGMHTMMGRLDYSDEYNTRFAHIIKYTKGNQDFSFQTLSEIKMTEEMAKGALLIETGSYRFLDRFDGSTITHGYHIDNLLQSTNMDHDLNINLLYTKPRQSHEISVDVFYPPENNIVKSHVDFVAINNVQGKINFTTPFDAFPNVELLVSVVTSPDLYKRYGRVSWKNQCAVFNYTHASAFGEVHQLTDGSVLVDFPLQSRHKAQLVYSYQSTKEKALGKSKLHYNDEFIMSGNYSRKTKLTPNSIDEIITINVNNSFMPAGILYDRKLDNDTNKCCNANKDFRRVEIYKLSNRTDFNLTGEYQVESSDIDKLRTIKGFIGQRNIKVESYHKGKNLFISRTNFTFKPGFWVGMDLSKMFKDYQYGHDIELNISYPRRHFTMHCDYFWEDEIHGQVVVHPNMLKRAKYMGAELTWKNQPSQTDKQSVQFTLSHPSFNKNVTLFAVYDKNESAILDVDVGFQYSTDEKKKLVITATLLKDRKYIKRWYQILSMGSHQATRFQYAVSAVGKLLNSALQVNSTLDYKRSYSPNQQFNSSFTLDARNKFLTMKRKSSWEDLCLSANFYRSGDQYLAHALYLNNGMTATDRNSSISANFSLDIKKCKTQLSVNFTPDSSEQLHMDGVLVDSGHAMLNVWRMYDDIPVYDLSSHIRLNTSRILSSQLQWRPTIPQDLMDLIHHMSDKTWDYVKDSAHFWTTYIKNEAGEAIADVWLDAKPILQDFLDDMRNIDDFLEDVKYFKKYFNESYNANEFYMQDIYTMYLSLAEEMAFKDRMKDLPKIFSELSDIMGETSETIRQSIIWAVDSVQKIYYRIVDLAKELISGETLNKISLYIQEIALKYDKIIKDVHITFIEYMEQLWKETAEFISEHWAKLLNAVEPTFITFAHHIESAFWEGRNKAVAFIFQGPADLIKNSVFTNNTSIKDLDKIYKEIMENDFMTTVKKYSSTFYEIVKEKYFSMVPFGYELNEIGTEVIGVAKELYKLPVVNFTIEATVKLYDQVVWMYDYFKMGEKIQMAVPLIYRLVRDTSHTALENEIMNHKSKTLFKFDVENGIIKLEQKLPMPWHAFNQTPNFEEIPEYRVVTRVQKWFAPSNTTFWTYYNQLAPLFDTASWFPPFQGRSIISGMQHFVTFDNSQFDLRYPCSFLLSKDYADQTFSLVLNYAQGKHTLQLVSGHRIVTYNPHDKTVSLNRGGILVLPLQIDDLQILNDDGILRIISDHGFELQCNFDYDVCVFSLSGWYFGKVAGLLGTMDNEPKTDYLASYGEIETKFNKFAMSWAIGGCEASGVPSHKKPLNNNEPCNNIYLSKASPLAACYPMVDPANYNMMCRKSVAGIQNEICTSAYSYIKACDQEYIPITMPNFCVRCPTINGTHVEEGDFYDLEGEDVPMSSDVVFIMEAKECNQYMRERRLVQIFVSTLTKELGSVGLSNNRFSVITFGGSGIFNEPRKVFVNNKFFTTERLIPNYFENIPSGNGNSDIFSALQFASKLQFRPGVSKTFILIPCSDCDPSNMTLDHQTLQTVLLEKDIKLHILMNADFDLEKLRVSKVFYGLDSVRAYTKSDFKYLKGDIELRRQIKLTKSMLGDCTILAMATNGTIFTGKKFGSENTALVKKFCNVFARRIAQTAVPSQCQSCECTTYGHGIHVTECFPCHIPTPVLSDLFQDNSTLTLFDRFDPIRDSDLLHR